MVKTAGKVYRDEEDLYTILCKYDAAILSGFSFRDFSPKVETAIAASENGGKVFCITKFKEKPERVFDISYITLTDETLKFINREILGIDLDKNGEPWFSKYTNEYYMCNFMNKLEKDDIKNKEDQ